jgi:hypothetical protein
LLFVSVPAFQRVKFGTEEQNDLVIKAWRNNSNVSEALISLKNKKISGIYFTFDPLDNGFEGTNVDDATRKKVSDDINHLIHFAEQMSKSIGVNLNKKLIYDIHEQPISCRLTLANPT